MAEAGVGYEVNDDEEVAAKSVTSSDNQLEEQQEENQEEKDQPRVKSTVEPLGFSTYIALFLITSVLPLMFIFGFSGVGYGRNNFRESEEFEDEADWVLIFICVLCFLMWVFDIHMWKSPLGWIVQITLYLGVFFSSCVALLMLKRQYPYGPICVFTILEPVFILYTKKVIYRNVKVETFVSWLHVVLLSLGLTISTFFIGWALSGEKNSWDTETRAFYSDESGCQPNFSDLPGCENTIVDDLPCFFNLAKTAVSFDDNCSSQCIGVYDDCTHAFIIWVNPGLMGLAILILGAVMKFLRPNDNEVSENVSFVMKCCVFMLFVFWVAASLAGAGTGIGSALVAFAMSMFVGMAIILMAVFWNSIKDKDGEEVVLSWLDEYQAYLNIAKGLFIVSASPLIIAYLFLSIANQFVRKHTAAYCNRMGKYETEHTGIFTKKLTEQLEGIKTWDHSTILIYGVYWGLAYISLDVLANRFTVLFLSWLIDFTNDMDLAAVTGVVVFVGMCLFLLPPVPGLPIYLTAGIVLVAAGENSLGLTVSAIYACAISLGIKMLACATQQKVIGELLGSFTVVRKTCQINSNSIRAIRYILGEQRLTQRKVAILIGGPDWPTSVLCGIMGLDLIPILIGTLPVVLLIIPTVLSGTFAYMQGIEEDDGLQKYPWADTMAAVSAATAGCVMFYMMFTAASSANDALTNHQDDIDQIPLDEEVMMAELAAERANKVYYEVIQWEKVPLILKASLILSVVLTTLSCYILVIFNSDCFEEYDLLYTIEDNLDGDWTNLIKYLGRFALLIFCFALVLLIVFKWWASNEVQKILGEDLEIVAEAVAPRSKTNIIANESDAVEVQEINE